MSAISPDHLITIQAANRVVDCLLRAFPKEPQCPIRDGVLDACGAIDNYLEATGQERSPFTAKHLAASIFDGMEDFKS